LAILAGILLGAVPVIGGGLYWMTRNPTGEVPVAPALPAQVSLRFNLTPADARVSVGGVAMASNPLVVARSDTPLEVTIEADGYIPVTRQVSRHEDQSLTISLAKAPPPAPVPPPGPVQVVSAPPAVTPAPVVPAVVAPVKPSSAHVANRDSSSSEVIPAIRQPNKPKKKASSKVDAKLMGGDDL
jgi:hypothetical protein